MSNYVRPAISYAEFRDDDGNVIPYGNRWPGHDGPPDDSYSAVDHPERFAPLHTVAEALIDYLAANFDVDVEEGYQITDGLPNLPSAKDVVRAARINPRTEGASPLVLVLTAGPAVSIRGGAYFAETYPSCNCNACDEDPQALIETMESAALLIANGGLTERIGEMLRPSNIPPVPTPGNPFENEPYVSHAFKSPEGEFMSGGGEPAAQIPVSQLEEIRSKLAQVAAVSPDGNWLAWKKKP